MKLFDKTHRCEESLKHYASIRFKEKWILYKLEYDWETGMDNHYNKPIYEIKYCPFCGIKLNKEEL
jgi:hypothetical protein